jgi:hypothetical protein
MAPTTPHTGPATLPLPVSTLFSNFGSLHPLLHLVVAPLLPRFNWIESTILLSPPSSLLLRLGLGSTSIITLSTLGGAAGIVRWREQWRFMLSALGILEAVGRSWNALDALERDSTTKGKEREKGEEKEREEIKHVLCFWIFFALVEVSGSFIRSDLSAKNAFKLPHGWRSRLRNVAVALHVLKLTPPGTPRTNRVFPQPKPFPSRPTSISPAPVELKRALMKLMILWVGLRKDGWGASALWDWGIGPILAVRRSRQTGRGSRKVVKVVVVRPSQGDALSSEEDDEMDEGATSPRMDHHSSGCSSSSSTFSPTSSPTIHATASYLSPTPSPAASPSPASQSQSSNFPTPQHIPYRLTSQHHPIHARSVVTSGSEGGYVVDEEGSHEGKPEVWGETSWGSR